MYEYVRYIVALSRHYSCHGKATIRSFFVVSVDVPVNNIKCSVVSRKCNSGFPLHYCQATNYFVLLLTVINIK
jgi:hypothetical protein